MSKNDNSKICAILAYIMLIGVIWYFVDEKMKKSSLAKFHVKQGLFLAIVGIGLGILFAILGSVLAFIPIIGWIFGVLLAPVGLIINLGILVLVIIGIINAANEKKEPVPVIGGFAEKVFTF